jgi:probable phosphoglycerate mutase
VAGKPVKGRYDVLLIFDGGARGNPGHGYGSFTYKGSVVRWQTSITYPGLTTNNQAEYQTMIGGLRAILFDCETLGIPPKTIGVDVRSDSQLLVNQVNGTWKIKHPGLRELHAEATNLLARFRRWELIWHPRAESVRILGH